MTRDHRYDDIIDAAARSMTDAEPAAGLRARVIAKLPATRNRGWMRIALPTAAALMLGMVAARGGLDPSRRVGLVVPVVPVVPVEPVNVAKLDPASHHVPVVPVAPVVPVVPADDAWSARAIPALPAVTQLTMSPIQPVALSIAPITMEPIVIGPVSDPRDGGRR